MNVVLGSAFRNASARHISRYMNQAAALRDAVEAERHTFRIRAVEGDSVDDTPQRLQHEALIRNLTLDLAKRDHGGPIYGSTEQPERMAALSQVGNGILEGVTETDNVLVYVESDLLWQAPTIMRLMHQLGCGRDIIAPLIFAGSAFYDIWAFRADGARFSPLPPYYYQLRLDAPTPVDSVGSCLVMRAEVARKIRMTTGALVEFCANARAAGYKIFCDARERINHP